MISTLNILLYFFVYCASVHDQVVPAGSSSSRVIVHVDLDCFYAQVEMISNPELKGKPLGVQQKSLVVTCNYEARELGVKKLMKVRDAKEKCPQLVLVNGEDLTRYREMSYKVTELLEEFSPLVERLGFDENFVDLTEMVEKRLQQLHGDELAALTMSGHVYNNQSINLHDTLHIRLLVGSQIAAEMREAMYHQLGLTGCAGVASNKLLAKLVSGVFKPNQQTVLLPESSQDLIHSLNHIKEMPGIGYKTTKRLEALGISSVHDLQTFSSKILEKELGISVAQRIQKLSFGEDNSPITPSGPPQSFSEEDSFKKCSSEVEAKNKIEELLASLLNRVCQDGRKPHTMRLIIRRFSSGKHCSRESRQCPIPSHIIHKLGAGNYDVMTPMVDILMKLFRTMVNVKMPFHLTLLSVCFCNLKALTTTKKGTIDYYLTPSLSTTSRSGKRSFKMKDSHMEDFSKDKETNWDFLPTGSIESTRTGESPLDTIHFSKEKDSDEFPLRSLPEGIDQEVFKQLPGDIQEEILAGKSGEKIRGKGSLSCPLPASRGVLSFFSTKQKQDCPLNPRDHGSNSKQLPSVSACEPGTSGLSSSSASYLSRQKGYSQYLDSRLKDERMGQGPKAPQGSHFSNTNPAVSIFRSFPNLQSEQLFSKNRTTDNHKQPIATVSHHEGLAENGEQDTTDEKITFPSDVDPEVFYELPEELQKELLSDWKRTGPDSHIVHK
ncbi:PREDICTED: DNA polymerase iota isoform X2 [Hipposideros armiger]|uniref:DNA polymerase iota n=1 Tax=Hipposideros armiger TaxID=186990 RepID=A0A8B7R6G3_HIPAR|nr:PREDICTED: DNA polymerase iota isoform X2 [Hipposideros armiger]XP_019496251.1 PREDICTED: DNA polymerase iota isoform X2 [Hipposideros armiger]XP_019496252.1 PREDICTED: DNA polymerase iota isoform X2 [Hipposideros armiger]